MSDTVSIKTDPGQPESIYSRRGGAFIAPIKELTASSGAETFPKRISIGGETIKRRSTYSDRIFQSFGFLS